MMTQAANQAFADNSTYALAGSAVVLALAMLAFALDLAGGQKRRAVVEAAAESQAEMNGNTMVLTREVSPDEPVKRQWAGVGMALSWLGFGLLLVAIVLRGLSVHRTPLGNMYEFALAAAGFTMAVFLIWSTQRDLRWFGVFITAPVVLTEMLAAMVLYTDATQLVPSLRSYWLSIHVTIATLSVGLFTVGFVLTLLHLAQARREAAAEEGNGKASFMDSLPRARTLDQAAYGVHVIAYPLWTFTVIAGAIWAQVAWGRYWDWDPKEVWSFVIFVVYTAYMHARVTSGWTSKRASYLAIAGFTCVILNYTVVNVFFVGMHSYSGL
ncbi:c-type cytochrome biogenesis protein CcsB [Demetria terragena]|uniref:c-type cytochrome biogenesis protein CcsB n=1 Tax=Demetria terragena TaxID=63959 RepID=UPI00038034AB|nr:c-type cytochrome biogenesis protein CcsB [Demetria terragena]